MLVELFDEWCTRLAHDLREAERGVETQLRSEARVLAAITRKLAPRKSNALADSIEARDLTVTVGVDYALLQDGGGTVTARQHGWLTIPVRRGYTPAPGFVTLNSRDGNQIVVRSGTYDLWAIRRRSVTIKGSRYLERALEQHLDSGTDKRVLDTLPDVKRGRA